MNISSNMIRAILLGIAVVILAGGAYLLYMNGFGISDVEAPTTPGSEQAPSGEEPTDSADVLRTPGQDASEEELREYYQRVEALAVTATQIDISGCVADPAVVKISRGSSVSFTNSDEDPHTIIMGGVPTYTVQPGATLNATPEFSQGAGLYAYSCDQASSSAAGIFIVSVSE